MLIIVNIFSIDTFNHILNIIYLKCKGNVFDIRLKCCMYIIELKCKNAIIDGKSRSNKINA